MQCPQMNCWFTVARLVFLGIGGSGLAVGFLSVFWPKRSIGLYQWIMERFNWRVSPIDESLEVRNTRLLGVALATLSLIIFFMVFIRR